MPTRSGGAAWPSRRCTPGARRCGSKSKHGRRTIRSPKLWRAQGCCEPTRIECCGRDAAAQSQSTGEGRSAAQSSGGLRAVANRPGSSAAGETLRLKVKARAKDDPQPKALAGSGLLRTDQDRVLLRFVEGRPVSRVTRAVATRPGSSAAALCRRPPGQPRHTGCCEPTRIECCCALSKAARSAASHGLLRTDQDRVLLRFVEGRPVSRVTTDFLAWGADRLAAEDKRVWVLVWDNAAWHVSRAVQAWIGTHNRTVKRTGGVRILVCRLPVKSPWLNPIEPRWLHGKRAVLEPEGPLTAHQLMDRVHQHFRCERLELLHQHVL